MMVNFINPVIYFNAQLYLHLILHERYMTTNIKAYLYLNKNVPKELFFLIFQHFSCCNFREQKLPTVFSFQNREEKFLGVFYFQM